MKISELNVDDWIIWREDDDPRPCRVTVIKKDKIKVHNTKEWIEE